MYKIIIADDECDVRKGIIESVQWQKHGFTVIGEAENGKEALDLCEKEMPDILITDINMPNMSGLELLEKLDEKFPRPKVIFLTAFDEFEYARKAVSLKASEYILKPITGEELTNLLLKLKAAMDEESAKREDIDLLRREFERNLPVLKEKFITLLLSGRLSPGDIEQKIKVYGIEALAGKSCLVGIIMADEDTDYSESGFDKAKHKEFIQFAVFNIANEIMEMRRGGITFLYGDNVILISLGDNEEPLVSKSLSVFCEIVRSIKKYLRFAVTIGAGYYCEKIDNIKHSYNSAVTACNYKMLLGGDKVIYIADIEPRGIRNASPPEGSVQGLINSLRSASWPEARNEIDKIFTEAACSLSPPDEYIPYVLEVVTAVLRTAAALDVNASALIGPDPSRFINMLSNSNLSEIKLWAAQTCEKVIGEISTSRQDFNKMIIKESIQYVREHYADPEIKLETICRHVHLSPSYFCLIFKKETNETFNNYLHLFRMQAAKELLRTTDYKLSEIAERTGYTDPNYFSFSFKKTFGVSPREYRTM